MGTKYTNGASMFMTTTHSVTEGQAWEIMVTDKGWSAIDGNSVYPIDIRVLGTDLEAKNQAMSGYNSASMTGLFFNYSGSSYLSAFIADGLATGSHLAFEFDGNLMGAFSLSGAKTAYDELVKCYDHYAVDLVL